MKVHFANMRPRRATKRRRRSVYQGSQTKRAVRVIGFEPLEGRVLLTTAATITWTGAGSNANWSTPGNWDLGRAPINGDSLVFPANAQNLASTDDISGLSVNSVTFQGSFAPVPGGYHIGGDDLTLGAGGISDNGTPGSTIIGVLNEINLNLNLGAAQSWSISDNSNRHQLIINGNVNNEGFALTMTGNDVIDVAGSISGNGGLTVGPPASGLAPIVELKNANTYTGATQVEDGTLIVDGSTGAASAVTVNLEGILGGTGTVGGPITLSLGRGAMPGGRLSPGSGPDPRQDVGTLNNTAGVTFDGNPAAQSESEFDVQLGGTSASPSNDQLNSAGTVALNDASLYLTLLAGAGPFNAGQQFVIVQAGAPITTTFVGLPEGSTVSDGTQNFTISYANDRVTLTALPAVPATITWTGNSPTSSNWSDSANWNLGRAPVSGDSLVFPAGAKQLANNDDIAGLSVNSITFDGAFTAFTSGFNLSGDQLTVGAGGVVDNAFFVPPPQQQTIEPSEPVVVIGLDLALSAAQSWSVTELPLMINGSVDNGGFELTATGNGTLDFDGPIAGSGGLAVQPTDAGSAPTVELQNANTYTGDTAVGNRATLIINGSTADASAVSVMGGTLGGTGSIGGKVTVYGAGGPAAGVIPAGTLDPGPGPVLSNDTGTLSNSGGVSFAPNPIVAPDIQGSVLAQFAVQLGGTAANPTNDQLDSAGPVSLLDATLNLTALTGAGPFNPGQQFVIIQAGAPITSTFNLNGLPEGATVSDGTQNFTISYANDRVTLTALPVVPPPPDSTYLNGQTADNTAATFIHNLYREVLGREAGAQEQAAWVNFYNQSAATAGSAAAQQAVVAGFLGSPEYRQHLVEVIYGNFLHRAADAGGLAFWTGQLAAGVDEKVVLADILDSAEYLADAGGSAPGWVNALYRDVLGRTADAGGLTFWTEAAIGPLTSQIAGRVGLEPIALAFLSTPEANHKLLNADYPGAAGSVGAPGTPAVGAYALADLTGNGWDNLYFQGRLSAAAVDSYFAGLQSGVSYDDTIAGMLDSTEYFAITAEPMAANS